MRLFKFMVLAFGVVLLSACTKETYRIETQVSGELEGVPFTHRVVALCKTSRYIEPISHHYAFRDQHQTIGGDIVFTNDGKNFVFVYYDGCEERYQGEELRMFRDIYVFQHDGGPPEIIDKFSNKELLEEAKKSRPVIFYIDNVRRTRTAKEPTPSLFNANNFKDLYWPNDSVWRTNYYSVHGSQWTVNEPFEECLATMGSASECEKLEEGSRSIFNQNANRFTPGPVPETGHVERFYRSDHPSRDSIKICAGESCTGTSNYIELHDTDAHKYYSLDADERSLDDMLLTPNSDPIS